MHIYHINEIKVQEEEQSRRSEQKKGSDLTSLKESKKRKNNGQNSRVGGSDGLGFLKVY